MTAMPPRTEPREVRLGRLRLRSMRRGIREMDLILQHFADRHLLTLAPADLDAFEALLEELDPEILAWITGAEATPARHEAMVARIREGAVGIWRPE